MVTTIANRKVQLALSLSLPRPPLSLNVTQLNLPIHTAYLPPLPTSLFLSLPPLSRLFDELPNCSRVLYALHTPLQDNAIFQKYRMPIVIPGAINLQFQSENNNYSLALASLSHKSARLTEV